MPPSSVESEDSGVIQHGKELDLLIQASHWGVALLQLHLVYRLHDLSSRTQAGQDSPENERCLRTDFE